MKKWILGLIGLAAIANFSLVQLVLAGEKVKVQLFFTSDLYGYIKPCG